MSTFNEIVSTVIDGAGTPDYHATVTIQLGELIQDGVFTWERVNWIDSAYSPDQYSRLCEAFENRFWLEEISMLPVGHWMRLLGYELRSNLMPKYIPMYAELDAGFDPFQNGGGYSKERRIDSDFPETLLTESQDYASKGFDYVKESIGRGNFADDFANYLEKFQSLDAMILNEIEKKFFCCLYTTNINGW